MAPLGYKKLDTSQVFCVRFDGDCGASVPIYRYAKILPNTLFEIRPPSSQFSPTFLLKVPGSQSQHQFR